MSEELSQKLKKLTEQPQETAEEKPKRKRGRPRKNPEEKKVLKKDNIDTNTLVTADSAIAEIIKVPFKVWAHSQDVKELALEQNEADDLSKPIRSLMDFYLPQMSPVGFVWINLSLTTLGIMSKRLALVSKIRKERKEKEELNEREENSLDNGATGKR